MSYIPNICTDCGRLYSHCVRFLYTVAGGPPIRGTSNPPSICMNYYNIAYINNNKK